MTKNVAHNQSHMEGSNLSSTDQKLALAKRCSREGVKAGAKAAVVASIATAIPTYASVRMVPWARANLNPTAQALIVSTGNCQFGPKVTPSVETTRQHLVALLQRQRHADYSGNGTQELIPP